MHRSWLSFVFLVWSCGNISFDVEQALPEQTVPGNPLGAVLPAVLLDSVHFTIDVKAEVAKRGTGPATSATLADLRLFITPHQEPVGTFDFLQEIHLFAEATGHPKVEIAKLTSVPRGQTTVIFDVVPGVDLLPYINAGAAITATATGSQPPRETKFDGKIVVKIRI